MSSRRSLISVAAVGSAAAAMFLLAGCSSSDPTPSDGATIAVVDAPAPAPVPTFTLKWDDVPSSSPSPSMEPGAKAAYESAMAAADPTSMVDKYFPDKHATPQALAVNVDGQLSDTQIDTLSSASQAIANVDTNNADAVLAALRKAGIKAQAVDAAEVTSSTAPADVVLVVYRDGKYQTITMNGQPAK